MSYWDGYQDRPDRGSITVVEDEPKRKPVIYLPDGKKLVPGKQPIGFSPERAK